MPNLHFERDVLSLLRLILDALKAQRPASPDQPDPFSVSDQEALFAKRLREARERAGISVKQYFTQARCEYCNSGSRYSSDHTCILCGSR
jgi:hypothetical protein